MKAAEHALRHRARILELLTTLDDRTIEDIARRGSYTVTPDGWPARTMSDGTAPGNSPYVGVESMVERRAFAGVDGVPRVAPDPTGDALRQLFDTLAAMAKLAETADTKLAYVRHVASTAEGRQSSTAGACQCCTRDVAGTPVDRLRNGYCSACNMAWVRDGRPERAPWEQRRRMALTEENVA